MYGSSGKGLFQQSSAVKPEESEESVVSNENKTLCDAATQTLEYPVASDECPKHSSRRGGQNFSVVQPTLCDKCSKSMLSYIALVQQFLEDIAHDVSQKTDPSTWCAECVRESMNMPPAKRADNTKCDHVDVGQAPSQSLTTRGKNGKVHSSEADAKIRKPDGTSEKKLDKPSRTKFAEGRDQESASSTEYRPRRPSRSGQSRIEDSGFVRNNSRSDATASVASRYKGISAESEINMQCLAGNGNSNQTLRASTSQAQFSKDFKHESEQGRPTDFNSKGENHDIPSPEQLKSHESNSYCESSASGENRVDSFRRTEGGGSKNGKIPHNFAYSREPEQVGSVSRERMQDCSPHIFQEDNVFDILSTRYRSDSGNRDPYIESPFWDGRNTMRKPSDSAQNTTQEGYVTVARNNTEALGCLVLGASLILCGTKRKLCILVADGVSTDFMAPLSSVFHVVQKIRSLDSLGTTKLALLDQPELGISFTKLNVWRLEQFTKCVYLNYDTLVVQNCDELFCYEELSAVPDIGWPDCFNSAVFVFRPSVNTFWQLVDFAEKQGSYDDGDQGLMNSYFQSWSQDIHKKLSFIYNLMANVSYTYTPAFRQFGRNVKIVQFIGTFKPWHVEFYCESGQIAPSSSVHPTYVQFIHVWLHVFRFRILPLFSQEIQNFTSSQNIVNAQELLRFFSSPNESELGIILTPPSVRLRPFDHLQFGRPEEFVEKIRRSSSSPNLRTTSIPDARPLEIDPDHVEHPQSDDTRDDNVEVNDNKSDSVSGDDTVPVETANEAPTGAKGNSLPGSEVGNYQGMSAWEQGRMDYQGSASSDTIIKRLHFLMKQGDRLV